jgi:hypothetical protein
MRLFLLPISTRRSLLYCEKIHEKAAADRTYFDKIQVKAAETWVAWEKDEKSPLGWKKKVTYYGNSALKRIPYEEWGLKTIPALTAKRREDIEAGRAKYEVMYPGLFLKPDQVTPLLYKLAKERQAMHRKKMIWSIVGMPISAPFALIPMYVESCLSFEGDANLHRIPNLPFFYLVYRAWSHWKALSGSKHLEFLLKHNLPTPNPSSELDQVYTAGLMYPTRQISRAAPRPSRQQAEQVAAVVDQQTKGGKEDVMVLQRWNGKLIAEHFSLPDMEIEIERAVEQVQQSIKANELLMEEKLELEKATAKNGQTAMDELPAEVLKHAEEIEHVIKEEAVKKIHEEAEKVADKGKEVTSKTDITKP